MEQLLRPRSSSLPEQLLRVNSSSMSIFGAAPANCYPLPLARRSGLASLFWVAGQPLALSTGAFSVKGLAPLGLFVRAGLHIADRHAIISLSNTAPA